MEVEARQGEVQVGRRVNGNALLHLLVQGMFAAHQPPQFESNEQLHVSITACFVST